ncbi:MAG: hypothetical protein WCL14_02710 [Bacteroidota bacterium]
MTRKDKIWFLIAMLTEKFEHEDDNSHPIEKILTEKFREVALQNNECDSIWYNEKIGLTIQGILEEIKKENMNRY